jgi:hypothetical protein
MPIGDVKRRLVDKLGCFVYNQPMNYRKLVNRKLPKRLAGATLGLTACLLFAGAGSSQAAPAVKIKALTENSGWHQAAAPLSTRWDKEVSPGNALPEYPRPQMTRGAWQNLNGLWDYGLTDSAATAAPAAYDGRILVPFCYESSLSGVGKASPVTQRLWYRRKFSVPAAWRANGQRVLLHFGAVNWDSAVSVNGQPMGDHKGGYDAFDYDVTNALKPGANEIVVSAFNPLLCDVPDSQVLGKQRVHPRSIFYTGATGIWQSVWLEPVPAAHIASLKMTPDVDAKTLHVTVAAPGAVGTQVLLTAMDGRTVVAKATGAAGAEMTLPIANPHLWSPSDPHLYGLKVSLIKNGKPIDSVGSYFAMRKISPGKDAQGRTTILLNNQPIFQVGALDQGYWPDGIYTAPTDSALRSDIDFAKSLGFNLLRKHAKVEPERWYYWTDKLGILVWQDMPQAFGDLNDAAKAQWLTEWKREIATHDNHPSIVVWTTFNEGWGQHDTEAIVALTKQLDPTRLVNNASGWTDKGVGDIRDTHAYPGPSSTMPEPTRAAVNGEFGGVTERVPDHMWTKNVMGYGKTLTNRWQVTQRYQELLKKGYGIRDTRGTCALVYTQLTDVEQESNGLMTYDRSVIKVLPNIVKAANEGRFLPLPPAPPLPVNHDLVPTSEDVGRAWQYTTHKPGDDWTKPDFDASSWKTGPAPFGQGVGNPNTPWTDKPGDIWLRRMVILPANIPANLVVRTIHDEDVEVYVNGVLAASALGFVGDYVNLPMSDAAHAALKPGENLIAVHCHQTVGGQIIDVGITAPKA